MLFKRISPPSFDLFTLLALYLLPFYSVSSFHRTGSFFPLGFLMHPISTPLFLPSSIFPFYLLTSIICFFFLWGGGTETATWAVRARLSNNQRMKKQQERSKRAKNKQVPPKVSNNRKKGGEQMRADGERGGEKILIQKRVQAKIP